MSTQQNPFRYKDGRTEIQSDNEKPHHIIAMYLNIIIKWGFRFTCAYWGLGYGIPKLISYLSKI
ncbi:MAG: hypothetical protein V4643_07200 [Bacteroidota bacterium]